MNRRCVRHQLLALVHHEHALDVELDAALHLGAVQVERGLARDVEQGVGLQRALDLDRDRAQRIGPVVGDVAVELVVLGVGDLALGAVPDRLHRVEGLVLQDLRIGRLVAVAPALHPDRVGDEVGVALDDVLEDVVGGVVLAVVAALGVGGLEVEGDGGAGALALGVAQGVRAVAGRLPAGRVQLAGAAGHQGDPVGDHERRVEPDAELADQLGRHGLLLGLAGRVPTPRLASLDRAQELAGAGPGDRADVLDHLLARHPDAVVGDRERALGAVGLDPDVEIGGVELGSGQLLEPQLVERVGGVGHQLAQEDVLVRVQRVDHEVQELLDLGLELVAFAGSGRYGGFGRCRGLAHGS